MVVDQQLDHAGTHSLGFFDGPPGQDLALAGSGCAGVPGRFDCNNERGFTRECARRDGLGGRDFRVKEYGGRQVGERCGYFQFEAREIGIIDKEPGWLCAGSGGGQGPDR